jgi:hypothetical protein
VVVVVVVVAAGSAGGGVAAAGSTGVVMAGSAGAGVSAAGAAGVSVVVVVVVSAGFDSEQAAKPSEATATSAAMVIFIGQIPPTDHTRLGRLKTGRQAFIIRRAKKHKMLNDCDFYSFIA